MGIARNRLVRKIDQGAWRELRGGDIADTADVGPPVPGRVERVEGPLAPTQEQLAETAWLEMKYPTAMLPSKARWAGNELGVKMVRLDVVEAWLSMHHPDVLEEMRARPALPEGAIDVGNGIILTPMSVETPATEAAA